MASSGRRGLFSQVLAHEMWASLAIAVMWLAVLFDALFGPDLVVSNPSGTTTIHRRSSWRSSPTSLRGLLQGTVCVAPETRADERHACPWGRSLRGPNGAVRASARWPDGQTAATAIAWEQRRCHARRRPSAGEGTEPSKLGTFAGDPRRRSSPGVHSRLFVLAVRRRRGPIAYVDDGASDEREALLSLAWLRLPLSRSRFRSRAAMRTSRGCPVVETGRAGRYRRRRDLGDRRSVAGDRDAGTIG